MFNDVEYSSIQKEKKNAIKYLRSLCFFLALSNKMHLIAIWTLLVYSGHMASKIYDRYFVLFLKLFF